MTKSTLTIAHDADGKLDVRLEFEPEANTTGPMTPDQSAAMAALEAVRNWCAGDRHEDDVPVEDEGCSPSRNQGEGD
jgi:hypothetical protein